jgi:3-oxoacyl-[acyl-carrier protein] reductase
MQDLDDKVALVTGGSRGIGRAIARALASHGASVTAVAQSAEELDTLAAEIDRLGGTILTIPADLCVEANVEMSLQAALGRFGHIDILVNSIGFIPPPVDLIDMSPELWRLTLERNLTCVAFVSAAVLRHMRDRGSGRIINIASAGGRSGARGRSAYRAAKAGVINLTESLAAEANSYGVDVNCICPAAVDTPGYRRAFGEASRGARFVTAEDVAEIAVFLASAKSKAITGTSIYAFGINNPLFSQ